MQNLWAVVCAIVLTVACSEQLQAQEQNNNNDNQLISGPVQQALFNYQGPRMPYLLLGQIYEADSTNLMRYEPSEMYEIWWKQVKSCSKLESDIDIRLAWAWLSVLGDAFTLDGTGPFGGYTFISTHTVLVLEKLKYDKWTIQHEMVHVLMHENNLPVGHDPKYFGPCGVLKR